MDVLHCIRKGFALASPAQVELLRGCVDIDVIHESWVPRWALEAAMMLVGAGYGEQQIRTLFGEGRERVLAELNSRAQSGALLRAVRPRNPYQRAAIDDATHAALSEAQDGHRRSCALCAEGQQCLDADLLQEEMQAQFPVDRRKQPRA
ncbi:MAG TPA: hypothetical protein VGH20_19885 [Myxococcales bacterium]